MSAHSLNSVRITRAGEQDLPAISALAGVIWRACYPGMISPAQIEYMLARVYSPDTLRNEMHSEGVCFEQLFLGNELVGYAAHGPAGRPAVFKLHKLYLHPARHGCGLGKLLLNHCEREVRQLGGRRLILNVNKRNTRAMAMYQRNGFRTVDAVVVDIGGGFVMDDYVMEKEL